MPRTVQRLGATEGLRHSRLKTEALSQHRLCQQDEVRWPDSLRLRGTAATVRDRDRRRVGFGQDDGHPVDRRGRQPRQRDDAHRRQLLLRSVRPADVGAGTGQLRLPTAFEWPLVFEHLNRLRSGVAVEVPVYDFTTHTRSSITEPAHPGAVIVVDGILVLHDPDLRELLDLAVYLDVDDDLRFIRRMGAT